MPEVLSHVSAPTMPVLTEAPLHDVSHRTDGDGGDPPVDLIRHPTIGSETASFRDTAAVAKAPARRTDEWAGDDWSMVLALPESLGMAWIRRSATGYVTASGLTFTLLDDYLFRSDGRWIRRRGPVFEHSDGRITRIEDTTYHHSDGSWTRRTGNSVTSSTGRRCLLSGDSLRCF